MDRLKSIKDGSGKEGSGKDGSGKGAIDEQEDEEDEEDDEGEDDESMLAMMTKMDIFNGIYGDAKEELLSQMEVKRFRPGEFVFTQGEKGDHLYIILKGKAGVLVSKEGEEDTEVAILEKGRFFGEQALLNSDSIRTATIVAKTTLKLLMLRRQEFQTIKGALDVLLLCSEKLPILRKLNNTHL